jgi:hypothetical protein
VSGRPRTSFVRFVVRDNHRSHADLAFGASGGRAVSREDADKADDPPGEFDNQAPVGPPRSYGAENIDLIAQASVPKKNGMLQFGAFIGPLKASSNSHLRDRR